MSSDNWLLFVGTVTYTFFFVYLIMVKLNDQAKIMFIVAISKSFRVPKQELFLNRIPTAHVVSGLCVSRCCSFFFFFPQVTQAGIDCVYAVMSFCNRNGHMSLFIRFLECQNHVCSLFPSKQSQDNGERILVLGLWDIFFFEIAFNKSDLIS